MKLFKYTLLVATILLVGCNHDQVKPNKSDKSLSYSVDKGCKQELTHSKEWISAWDTCSGYTALKKDGTLWQFGKAGGCNWGQITPVEFKPKYTYHLKPTMIGTGFKEAKIINGGYRLYAIKKDGTLWGWGEGIGLKPLLLSKSHEWSDFGIKSEGNACFNYDVGLKKDGTLWRFPEFVFARGQHKTPVILKKISKFSDWKKIALGCESIYGMRRNGSLWKSDEIRHKDVFKKYKLKKLTYDADRKLYLWLKSKMVKVASGTVYNPDDFLKKMKVQKDGTLCLLPEESY